MKIINKAVISKCRECKMMFISDGRSPDKYYCPVGIFRPVNPDTIDKDCPLQECEVIEFGAYGNWCNPYDDYIRETDKSILKVEVDDTLDVDDIEKIIIVKKPRGE